MTAKNKYYLLLSILTFLAVLVAILKTFETSIILGVSIEPIWIVIWFFALVLPIVNLAEIINNRNESNVFYWIGLLLNLMSIIFLMRHYQIDIF